MRNLLAGLATLMILFSILGWGRSWYTVGPQPADAGKLAFRVELDGMKVGSDVVNSLSYVRSKLSSSKDKDDAIDSNKESNPLKP